MRKMAAEWLSRTCSNTHPPKNHDGIQHNHGCGSQQPQLLSDDGQNKIGMGFREKSKFLFAFS